MKLPYIKAYKDRHGTARYYFRRKGFATVALPSPTSPGFMAAYEAANSAKQQTFDASKISFLHGSLGWLIDQFVSTKAFNERAPNTWRSEALNQEPPGPPGRPLQPGDQAMKITLEATGYFEKFEGVMCRLWKGATGAGTPVEAYIPCLRAPAGAAQADLERELRELKVERQLASFDARLIT